MHKEKIFFVFFMVKEILRSQTIILFLKNFNYMKKIQLSNCFQPVYCLLPVPIMLLQPIFHLFQSGKQLL